MSEKFLKMENVKSLPNILIVDDLDVNLYLLEMITSKIEVNVIRASSGAEALAKTHGIELALAILDIWMPEMNGFELAERMNEEQVGDKVPVIFLTANSSNESDMFEGYSLGAVDYIIKPVNPNILRSKINVFLELFNQKKTIINEAAKIEKSNNELVRSHEALMVSEGRLEDIIFNMADWMWEVDENGIYTYCSDDVINILGYSPKEIFGKTPFDFMSPDEGRRVAVLFFEILANKLPIKDLENWNIRNDGKEICLLTNGVPIFDKNGNLKGYRGVDRDITHRIEMEESIRNYQIELEMQNDELKVLKEKAEVATKKYSELYEFAPSGYFSLSIEKEIKELNLNGAVMLGGESLRLIGQNFGSFISNDSDPIFNDFLQHIINSKTKQTCEFILQTENNHAKYIYVEGIFDDNNQQYLLNVIDISVRKQIEEELNLTSTRLTLATHASGIGVWDLDVVNSKLIWDDQMFVLYGVNKKDIENIYDYWLENIHPDDKDKNDSEILMAILDEKEFKTEFRICWPDGSIHYIKANAFVLRDHSGKPLHMIGTAQDITERKKTEQELKISEEKYRTMLNASPDGILLIDLQGTITEVSEIGFEIFDADQRDDLVGKNIHQFIPSDETNSIKDIFEKTVSEGLVQNVELKIRKKSQSLFQSEISSTLIQAPDGEPLSFMIIIRDISQRKKTETKKLHDDRMANLGEMASGMAHEINQPLNIISMVMDKILFETDKTDTIDIEFLKNKSDKIFENITRIKNIIDHVRAFSRNDDKYVLTAFDINSSIENATSLILEQFKHLGITLNLQLDYTIPQIVGNTYKLEQVIINLLANAKDAVIEKKNKQGESSEMTVEIRTYRENQSLIVEITDSGIGIDNDDLHDIILPFYTTKEEGKGTGLGLSICYQILEEMNGTIDISSDRINGTKIKLVLNFPKTN